MDVTLRSARAAISVHLGKLTIYLSPAQALPAKLATLVGTLNDSYGINLYLPALTNYC